MAFLRGVFSIIWRIGAVTGLCLILASFLGWINPVVGVYGGAFLIAWPLPFGIIGAFLKMSKYTSGKVVFDGAAGVYRPVVKQDDDSDEGLVD